MKPKVVYNDLQQAHRKADIALIKVSIKDFVRRLREFLRRMRQCLRQERNKIKQYVKSR
jgi:hypothetical protein